MSLIYYAKTRIKILMFNITNEQRVKIHKWLTEEVYPDIKAAQNKNEHDEWNSLDGDHRPYSGAIGGELTYSFTPTSLGVIVKVSAWGKELDLTNYDDF